MTGERPEWRKRLDKARILAWLSRGKVTAGPGHPASEWTAALEAWHTDGDKTRMADLIRMGATPPPEMLAIAREAVADALGGANPRLRNHMPADLRRTLEWRAARSWRIKQEMKPTWKREKSGETLNQAVADAVNREWREGGLPWRAPIDTRRKDPVADDARLPARRLSDCGDVATESDRGGMATERTVADDAREVAKNVRQ